jgi:hypothetical protein
MNVHPRHHLVAARVGGLVQVDDPVLQVLLERPRQRRAPDRQRRVVAGPDVQLVVVLEQKRPRARVEPGGVRAGGDESGRCCGAIVVRGRFRCRNGRPVVGLALLLPLLHAKRFVSVKHA